MKFIMQNCRNKIQNYSGTFGKHWLKFIFVNHLWMVSLLGQFLTWSSYSSSFIMCVDRNGHTRMLVTSSGSCKFGKHSVMFKFGNHLRMVSLLGQCLTWSSNSSSVTMCVERNGHTRIFDTRSGFCKAHFLKCLCSLSGKIEWVGSYGQVTCFSFWRKEDIISQVDGASALVVDRLRQGSDRLLRWVRQAPTGSDEGFCRRLLTSWRLISQAECRWV